MSIVNYKQPNNDHKCALLQRKQFAHQKGFTLVSALLGVGIASILVLVFVTMFTDAISNQKHVEQKYSLIYLHNEIYQLMTDTEACRQTLANAPALTGPSISYTGAQNLKNAGGTPVYRLFTDPGGPGELYELRSLRLNQIQLTGYNPDAPSNEYIGTSLLRIRYSKALQSTGPSEFYRDIKLVTYLKRCSACSGTIGPNCEASCSNLVSEEKKIDRCFAIGGFGENFWKATTAGDGIYYPGAKVGIGTTAPISPLHIDYDILPQDMYMTATVGGHGLSVRSRYDVNAGGEPRLTFIRSRGTRAMETPAQAGDQLGDLLYAGHPAVNTLGGQSAGIRAFATEGSSLTAAGGRLTFFTTHNGTIGLQPRLTIQHDGYVGIGTTLPSNALHIHSADNGKQLALDSSSGATWTQLNFLSNGVDQSFIGHNNASNYLVFGGQDTNTGFDSVRIRPAGGGPENDIVTIKRSGNVGVGTNSPTEKLHVFGNLRIQGSTDCTLGNGTGGTNCSSDIRLKKNIIPIENALLKISAIRGIEFDWNKNTQSAGKHGLGVIAQEVEKQFPTAVIEDPETGYKKVDYSVLVAPLIEALKEVARTSSKKASDLMKDNAALKGEIAEVKAYICEKDPQASICQNKVSLDVPLQPELPH